MPGPARRHQFRLLVDESRNEVFRELSFTKKGFAQPRGRAMLRRPTPWQRGCRAQSSHGLVTKLVRTSLGVAAIALAVLVTFVPTAVGAATDLPVISYTIDGIAGTN